MALEVGDQGGAEVAEGLLARVQGHVGAKDVEGLDGDAHHAPVRGGVDEARARQQLDAPRHRGVHLAGLDDLVAQQVAVGRSGLELAPREDRLPGDAIADRARQAILSGREFEAGTRDGDLLCDEVVEPGEMDAAIAGRVEALTSSGLVNAAANRRALRVGEEPLEVFREYMAVYAREQAVCHLSPALVENLERNWNAKERRV